MTKEDLINRLISKGFSRACAIYHGTKLYDEQYGMNKDKYSEQEKNGHMSVDLQQKRLSIWG